MPIWPPQVAQTGSASPVAPGFVVVGLGHVHRVVEGVCVEDAQEEERRAQLLERGRGDPVEARVGALGRDGERGLGVLSDD